MTDHGKLRGFSSVFIRLKENEARHIHSSKFHHTEIDSKCPDFKLRIAVIFVYGNTCIN